MPNQSGKIVLILVLLLLLLGAGAYLFLPGLKQQKPYMDDASIYTGSYEACYGSCGKESTPSASQLKNYYFEALNINLKVPQDASIEEKFTDLLIVLSDGVIQIRRIGTNFNNITEYIDNLVIANKMTLLSKEQRKINNTDVVLITMKDPASKTKILKEYSIYVDNWVFKLSTSDEPLYPVLDQIVQSFEYKGTLSSGEDKP